VAGGPRAARRAPCAVPIVSPLLRIALHLRHDRYVGRMTPQA